MSKKDITLMKWLKMDTQKVLDKFSELPGAIHVGEGLNQFVYIPGTRKNKLLFVAHSDTVWDDCDKIDPIFEKGIYKSKNPKVGIGADDRAGIAILWKLRDSGHSLLIPNGEESGGKGSDFLMGLSGYSEEINSHQFAIEFDRHSANHLVFYRVGSPDLLKFLQTVYKEYKEESGSYTDISTICETMAGVNISVGYKDHHSTQEILVQSQWQRTLDLTIKLSLMDDVPRFDIQPMYSNFGYSRRRGGYFHDDVYDTEYEETFPFRQPESKFPTLIVCPSCEAVMDIIEVDNNNGMCVYPDCETLIKDVSKVC